jgi:glycosyltransferase involved in cell wall biosynthesis
MVGSLAHLIKGPDVLIDSVGICLQAGLEIHAAIIGDGAYREKMEARCRALGLQDKVKFTGQVSSAEEVRNQLDQTDLFVLPSITEGMPRAMLEAMARGVPCIGTAVGGIPELLPPEDLVPPGDAAGLAQKIMEVAANPERLARMSTRGLHTSQAYSSSEVAKRRSSYCRALKQATIEWITEHPHFSAVRYG